MLSSIFSSTNICLLSFSTHILTLALSFSIHATIVYSLYRSISFLLHRRPNQAHQQQCGQTPPESPSETAKSEGVITDDAASPDENVGSSPAAEIQTSDEHVGHIEDSYWELDKPTLLILVPWLLSCLHFLLVASPPSPSASSIKSAFSSSAASSDTVCWSVPIISKGYWWANLKSGVLIWGIIASGFIIVQVGYLLGIFVREALEGIEEIWRRLGLGERLRERFEEWMEWLDKRGDELWGVGMRVLREGFRGLREKGEGKDE